MNLFLYEIDDRKLVHGTITKKRPGTGAAEGKVVNIEIEGNVYDKATGSNNKKTIEIAFWNSNLKNLADDANNKLEVGKYVSVLVTESKDAAGKTRYSALAFKKQGIWRFTETLDDAGNVAHPETNFIIGRVTSGYRNVPERYRVVVPVTRFDKDNNSYSEWISITFFQSANQPNLPDNAEKVLAPYKPEGAEKAIYRNAAIRCGAAKSWKPDTADESEKEHISYVGFSFDRID